uniref:Reverse transcriptase domain-containing protein n=1 Tax=Tanacetum cinerariifolium TaxID=118510 RepID=A0A699H792_TANCI|nr:reverse transcriptase domain-containing protein [Tanacetum cinerariifolium]
MTTPIEKRNHAKFCEFHGEVGHNTDDCMHLKKQIKEILKEGKLSHLIKELKQNNRKEQPKAAKKGETSGKDKAGRRRNRMTNDNRDRDRRPLHTPHNQLMPATTLLIGFNGEIIWSIGKIQLLVKIEDEEHSTAAWMNFVVVRSPSPYNGIIERPRVRKLQAVSSKAHEMLKLPVEGGVITLKSSRLVPLECAMVSGPKGNLSATKKIVEERVKVAINPEYPKQTVMIGSTLLEEGRNKLCDLLHRNLDIFAWKPADMTGKVEAILCLPSPKCLNDVQKLNRKLAGLKRFLAKSAEKSLPFFKTLKDARRKGIKRSGDKLYINREISTSLGTCHQAPKEILLSTPNHSNYGLANTTGAIKTEGSKEIPACFDDDDDSNFAITPNEPVDSLSMGDEHLNTIPAMESDEFIKSSVENLVPNPSESEGENKLSEKIYSNPLFDEEIISMKIDPHHLNAESDLIESLLNHDSCIISSSSKIDSLFDKFAGELTLLKSISPGIDETDCYPEEETHFTKRLLYDNSYPRPPKEFVSENSNADIKSFSPSPIPVEDNDSLMKEIDLSFTLDDPMLPGIQEDDNDSERDNLMLEELLDNHSLSLIENESFYFDIPSSFCTPTKPPDGNIGILNIKMMGDISEQKFLCMDL